MDYAHIVMNFLLDKKKILRGFLYDDFPGFKIKLFHEIIFNRRIKLNFELKIN